MIRRVAFGIAIALALGLVMLRLQERAELFKGKNHELRDSAH
jgi:hypothetical protein